ncbi:MAG: hydroxyacylglutathione hydrolase [Phycisphaerae bacterium]|nr:hydroxyacylglutathione hydrolase [Phycisphaerae bacterium]
MITIPAFGDNLIYLYRYNQSDCLAVDPGECRSVLKILREQDLSLKMILVTHHHWDHTGGVAELKQKTGCKVIGGDKQRIRGVDQLVEDADTLPVGDAGVHVIATAGHTSTSVCYYVPPSPTNSSGILWTGDTLFVGGCGRLLEGNAKSMSESLQKLASLPDDTLVYCGHDYTLENYEFALSIEPDNQAVRQRLNDIRQTGQTVPSTILQENTTNVFLLAGTPELKAALDMPQAKDVEAFAELRQRKDSF